MCGGEKRAEVILKKVYMAASSMSRRRDLHVVRVRGSPGPAPAQPVAGDGLHLRDASRPEAEAHRTFVAKAPCRVRRRRPRGANRSAEDYDNAPAAPLHSAQLSAS